MSAALVLSVLAGCHDDGGLPRPVRAGPPRVGDAPIVERGVDEACAVVDGRPVAWAADSHGDEGEPAYDRVFDKGRVRRLDIVVAPEDYAAMYTALEALIGVAFGAGPTGQGASVGNPPYVPVTVRVDDATWCGVGMRFKGNSSLFGAWTTGIGKLPFRLDFDRFEDARPELDDQRFWGFEELGFGNGFADPTYLRDVLASEILEDQGVPAARNGFWAVHVDFGEGPVYFGLYVAAEDPADTLTARVWGDGSGNLYKPDGGCGNLTCFDEDSFPPETEGADGADVRALVEVLGAERGATWRSELEAVVDVDGFLRWLAVNSAMENWDAYGGTPHNYYLYGVPDEGGRLAWIPWDHNHSQIQGLQGPDDPLHRDLGPEWPLIRHVLDDPEYAARYRAYLADALTGLYAPGTYEGRVEELRAVITPAVEAEIEGYTFFPGKLDEAFEDLYAHVEGRRATVEAALQE